MRLVFVIGLLYLITLMTASFISIHNILFIICVAAACLGFSPFIKKFPLNRDLAILCGTVILALVSYMANYHLNVVPIRNFNNMDLNVTGKIIEIPYKSKIGKYYYIFKVENIQGMDKQKDFKVRLSSNTPIEAEVYDNYTCKIHVFVPENTPEFPTESFYRAKGIYLHGFFYDYEDNYTEPMEGEKPFYYYALKMRKSFISAIYSLFSQDQAEIISAILLGERHVASDDIMANFDKIGTYHFLAVSGIHISIFSKILVDILIELKMRRRKSALISITVVLAFMAMSGFSSSVVRAGIMAILYLIAYIGFKQSNSFDALGIAILAVAILRPDSGGDISLWLSFMSTFGIMLMEPKIMRWILNKYGNKKYYKYFSTFIVKPSVMTISASVCTFPIICFYYKKISLISILSNILLIFPITAMIFCAFFSAFFYIINASNIIIMPFKIICGCASNYTIWMSSRLSLFPNALISLDYLFIRVWVIITVIFFITCLCFDIFKKQFKEISVFSLSLLLIFTLINQIIMKDTTRISAINSGEGCTLVISENNYCAVILSMNEKTYEKRISDYMFSINSSKIDLLVVMSCESTNLEFLERFIDLYNPQSIIFNDYKDIKYGFKKHEKIVDLGGNYTINMFDNITLESREFNGTNLMMIKVGDKKILVCPYGGDADDVSKEWKNCDVLIAGGLPANYEKIKFSNIVLSMPKKDLDIVSPKIANKNNLLSTALCGTVWIDVNKHDKLSVRRKI